MWLLGMLAGLILGVLGGSFELAVGGAVLGTVAGAFFQRSRGADRHGGEDRLRALEAKLDWLYRQQREMQTRIQALEGTALPAASAAVRRSRSGRGRHARRRFRRDARVQDADCAAAAAGAAAGRKH